MVALLAIRNRRGRNPQSKPWLTSTPSAGIIISFYSLWRSLKLELAGKLEKTGFVVSEMNFFNLPAALPWLINGRLLKRDYIPAGQANLANLLVPLLKLVGVRCQVSGLRCQLDLPDVRVET